MPCASAMPRRASRSSRRLATAGHYPAIDVLESVSRLFNAVVPPTALAEARSLLAAMALYRENEDLIQIGAYPAGSSAEIDRAIALRPGWQRFLRQARDEHSDLASTRRDLAALLAAGGA
jgi:flagellum-specific ATP synthase